MRFFVTRTSSWNHEPNHQPCEKAKWENEYWVINLDSIDDILDFIKKNGRIIIDDDDSIEIYDDYRE